MLPYINNNSTMYAWKSIRDRQAYVCMTCINIMNVRTDVFKPYYYKIKL